MPATEVSISIDDAHLPQFAQIVKQLKHAGLKVEHQLGEIGVVTGSVASTKVDKLSAVEGVSSVEVSREFKLPPPSNDIQ